MQTPANETRPSFTAWGLVALCTELGFIIAVPLVLGVLGGVWVDRRFGTTPWVMLAGVIVALGFSTILVVRRIARS